MLLFMQLQRQVIRIKEECHFLSGKRIHPQRFTCNAKLLQLFDCLFNIFHTEGQMP